MVSFNLTSMVLIYSFTISYCGHYQHLSMRKQHEDCLLKGI